MAYCNKLHFLLLKSATKLESEGYKNGAYKCDKCNENFSGETYHCSKCQYDLCPHCYHKEEIYHSVTRNFLDDNTRKEFLSLLIPLQKETNKECYFRKEGYSNNNGGQTQDLIDPTLNATESHEFIPSEFNPTTGVFLTEINNLYQPKYSKLYEIIGHVLKKMYPMFVSRYPTLSYEKCQVIVKMQDYQIRPGESYEGKFHHEGLKRDYIKLVGIYVLELCNFYTKHTLDITNNFQSHCVTMTENTAVVFTNEMDKSHQLSRIYNNAQQTGTRKVLLFWIIDPSRTEHYDYNINNNCLNLRIKCHRIVHCWGRTLVTANKKQSIGWNDISTIVTNFISGDEAFVINRRTQFRAMRSKKEPSSAQEQYSRVYPFAHRINRCNLD